MMRDIKSHHPLAHTLEHLYEVIDPASGLHALIAIHSTRRGPGFGGIRRRRFGGVEEAVAEVVGLATHMTLKTALAELPCGGAKAVILDHDGLDRPRAYEALGRAIDALEGRYFCGPDVGTGEEELEHVRAVTRHVNARHHRPGLRTAQGVLAGFDALRRVAFPDRDELHVVVQGLGSVGAAVAAGLLERGCGVTGGDVDPAAATRAAAALPALALQPPDALLATPADVLAPCALGPVVTAANVDSLRFAAICGAANNQLAEDALADRLAQRGIAYVPDVVLNAGAVIEGALGHLHPGPDAAARVDAAIARIGERVTTILREAGGRSTVAVLHAMAQQALR